MTRISLPNIKKGKIEKPHQLGDCCRVRAPMKTPPLTRLTPVVRSLGFGILGGGIAAWAHVPLAWMLGAMTANILAALAGKTLHIPQPLRRAMLAVAGVYIGAGFSPQAAGQLGAAPASLALMLAYVAIATVLSALVFRKFLSVNAETAFCASIPGGLTVAIALSEKHGDERVVALMQVMRVTMIVLLVPLIARATLPVAAEVAPAESGSAWPVLLIAGSVAGIGFAMKARAPMFLLVAAGLSGLTHFGGWSVGRPPDLPLNAAMTVLGAAVGSGFGTFGGARFFPTLLTGLAVFLGMLILSALFAAAGAAILDIPFWTMMLAFAPGGVAEVSLIAVALDLNPPFVALHQAARILVLIALAPVMVALISRWKNR